MTNLETKMTDEPMTLRERVITDIMISLDDGEPLRTTRNPGLRAIERALSRVCDALEDTGAPAHMRVAKELRGEE